MSRLALSVCSSPQDQVALVRHDEDHFLLPEETADHREGLPSPEAALRWRGRRVYRFNRKHSSIGYLTPAQFTRSMMRKLVT